MINGFHEVRFPEKIDYMFQGGPAYKTTIIQSASGNEQRIAQWGAPLNVYKAASGPKNKADMYMLTEFFHARMGRLYGFRWKDWNDYTAVNQVLVNNGTAVFQLQKTYKDEINPVTRKIAKPRKSKSETKNYTGIRLRELDHYDALILPISGLQSYWTFNNYTGNITPAFGTVPLVPTGRVTYLQDGPFSLSRAVKFEGNGFFEGAPLSPTSGPITIELWVKPTEDDAALSAGGIARGLIGVGTHGSFGLPGFSINVGNSGIYFEIWSELQGYLSTVPLPIGTWNQVVLFIDTASANLKVYLNGALVYHDSTTTYPDVATDAVITVGRTYGAYNASYFTGEIANLAIYNVELSSARVLAHYNMFLQAPIVYTENTDYTVDYTTGLVTLTGGARPHYGYDWTGEYDVPARFVNDVMNYSRDSFSELNWQDLQVTELRNGS